MHESSTKKRPGTFSSRRRAARATHHRSGYPGNHSGRMVTAPRRAAIFGGGMLAALFLGGAAPSWSLAPEPHASPSPSPAPITDRVTRFSGEALHQQPRASDPWSLLRDVPGLVLDRVGVGGSETAQQSLVVAAGDPGSGTTWRIDGADVTDPAALGFTAVYPDMRALSEVEVSTLPGDVPVRTAGAQVAL